MLITANEDGLILKKSALPILLAAELLSTLRNRYSLKPKILVWLAGIEALREIAGLTSIATAVPVTANLVFRVNK